MQAADIMKIENVKSFFVISSVSDPSVSFTFALWGFNFDIIPIIIGGLGAVTHKLKDYLALIPGKPNITLCQKITLLGSKKILSDVLSRRR